MTTLFFFPNPVLLTLRVPSARSGSLVGPDNALVLVSRFYAPLLHKLRQYNHFSGKMCQIF